MTRRVHGDDGAYAILYGLLLTVIIGVAAIVVDLAAMREDRRTSRLASDNAALAGARALDPLAGGNPNQACTEAWDYVRVNMDVAVPGTTGCATFPTAFTTCPSSELTATATSENVTVTITWPVLQNSDLLTKPNAQPADSTVTAQEVDVEVDGEASDACSRLGVTVAQVHEPFLAGVFGVDANSTSVTSVARALAVPGSPEAIAALNVLNEHTCQAILTSGQGFVQVNAVGTRPGIVSVESDGRDQAGGCPHSRPWVIDPADNSSGAYVRADAPGATGEGLGVIYSYALKTGNNPTEAFDPALVPPSGTILRPRPTLLSARVGDAPVRDIYDCTGSCDEYPESYVATLKSRLQSGTLTPYEHHETPYNLLPFVTLPGPAVSSFTCNDGPNTKVLLPAANYYLNCPTLNVQGTLVIGGGTVVTRGGINVSGCFAFNTPQASGTATCPTVTAAGETSPTPTQGGILYMRSGSFAKGAQGSVFLPRTFVYMNSGAIDFGGGTGRLYWTNPRQDGSCTTDECQAERFSKLALWNESTTTQSLGGQSSLTMRGVVFVPKAKFRYTGQTTQNQTSAQFWADTIEVTGQSGLTMAPDPTDAVASPALGVALIR